MRRTPITTEKRAAHWARSARTIRYVWRPWATPGSEWEAMAWIGRRVVHEFAPTVAKAAEALRLRLLEEEKSHGE